MMTFFEMSVVQDDLQQIKALLQCGIFQPQHAQGPLMRSAFVDVMICLRDLMSKAAKHAQRISFTDDVTITKTVTDVTGLIKYVRDALCHIDSDHHFVQNGQARASLNVMFGACVGMNINGVQQCNPYPDDVCFYFGPQRIFLRRHIVRALLEAEALLRPMLAPEHGQ